MSERDPRLDPRPGDILRQSDCPDPIFAQQAKVTMVVRSVHYEMTQPLGPGPLYRLPMMCRMLKPAWRKWAKTAEVIHRADDGGAGDAQKEQQNA